MPVTNGVSTLGLQTVQPAIALTAAEVTFDFTSTPTLPFERVGYLYVFVLQSTSPFQTRLLARTPLYRPGQYLAWSNRFGFSGVLYQLQVQWNKPGLNWRSSTT